MSFSHSGTYNHVTDEAVLQTDDSIGEEDGDNSLHGYKRVCYQLQKGISLYIIPLYPFVYVNMSSVCRMLSAKVTWC